MLLKLYLILYLLLPNVVQPFHFFHIFHTYYGSTVKDCPKKVTNLLAYKKTNHYSKQEYQQQRREQQTQEQEQEQEQEQHQQQQQQQQQQ